MHSLQDFVPNKAEMSALGFGKDGTKWSNIMQHTDTNKKTTNQISVQGKSGWDEDVIFQDQKWNFQTWNTLLPQQPSSFLQYQELTHFCHLGLEKHEKSGFFLQGDYCQAPKQRISNKLFIRDKKNTMLMVRGKWEFRSEKQHIMYHRYHLAFAPASVTVRNWHSICKMNHLYLTHPNENFILFFPIEFFSFRSVIAREKVEIGEKWRIHGPV